MQNIQKYKTFGISPALARACVCVRKCPRVRVRVRACAEYCIPLGPGGP